ncbi:MAG: orotate phosphoribosyltransferase [Desulfobacterales bacterium]|nr:orotate phosphoribosyltransferase [Desulfobacterales bacterium]MBF0397273.1 orotate phosphoribosyltransferase [Desulfobacterales bacterium]
MEYIERLKKLIKQRSFKKTDTPSIRLSSGKMSHFYFNLKRVTYYPEGQFLIGNIIYQKIQSLNLKPKAIGGLTMGADPIATSIAFASYIKNNPIQAFAVRKEPKSHGMGLQIEGCVEKDDEVIILDDVITTGKSTIQAIKIARDYGLKILAAIVLVDRLEENGCQNIEAQGVSVHSVFTVQDFI